jgi:hypothetical protein
VSHQGLRRAGARFIRLSGSINTSRPTKLTPTRRSALYPLLLAALVLGSAAPAFAVERTTQPGTTLRVYVTLSDKGIKYTMFDTLQTGGQTGLVPARGGGVRGEVAIFTVRNAGQKPHDFALLGKKTPALRHGRKSVFSLVLLRRGRFQYRSTLDKGRPAFRGVFVVR